MSVSCMVGAYLTTAYLLLLTLRSRVSEHIYDIIIVNKFD